MGGSWEVGVKVARWAGVFARDLGNFARPSGFFARPLGFFARLGGSRAISRTPRAFFPTPRAISRTPRAIPPHTTPTKIHSHHLRLRVYFFASKYLALVLGLCRGWIVGLVAGLLSRRGVLVVRRIGRCCNRPYLGR